MMTRDKAIDIIKERVAIDRNLLQGDTTSDYAKFILEQDEALEIALEALEWPGEIICGFCRQFVDEDVCGVGWCDEHNEVEYSDCIACGEFVKIDRRMQNG